MKLFKHQQDALILARNGNLAMFHECGCGKTATALHIIKHWYALGESPALVVCPLSIIESAWIEDCKKFTPELDIVSLWSDKPAERKQRLLQQHDIYVCNYETFKNLYKEIQAKNFGILIVDESSKMKCPTSQITRSLLAMAGIKTKARDGKGFAAMLRPIPHRYVLSGTPAPNDESEYWSQVKFITGQGNKMFNDNFYAFRNRYFYSIPLGRTGQKIFKFRKDMNDEFRGLIGQVAHVVSKKDAIDLPDQVHEIRYVELSKDERKAYETMKNDLVLQFENETILATSALVECMKLRQLTSGFCYGDDTNQTGTSKLVELKDLLEEIGDKQVIIWANFRFEIAKLLEMIPNSAALWSGTPDREQVISDFKSGKMQYLIANPQSAAHGLTFTNCNYAVYFSLNYSYKLQKQSEDRLHRIGQNTKCTYYHLIAKNTIDEVVYKAINRKADLSIETLNYLKQGSVTRHGRQLQTA